MYFGDSFRRNDLRLDEGVTSFREKLFVARRAVAALLETPRAYDFTGLIYDFRELVVVVRKFSIVTFYSKIVLPKEKKLSSYF